jgi:predicted nucleic acid-binding protein
VIGVTTAESIGPTTVTVVKVRTGSGRLRASRRRTTSRTPSIIFSVTTSTVASSPSTPPSAKRRSRIGAASRSVAEIRDCQIARITYARRATTLATRNVRHFEPLGVTVADPWDES